MNTPVNPYMVLYTSYMDDLEKAAKSQRVRPYGEPRRSRARDWALGLAVVAVAFGLVAVSFPGMA